jgi:hypothetical protein
VSRVTVMDPLGGPGEARGLRRLKYLAVAPDNPEAVFLEGEPSTEEDVLQSLLAWLGGDDTCLVVPHGTVILALDPDTGACVWGTGAVPAADASGNPVRPDGPAP